MYILTFSFVQNSQFKKKNCKFREISDSRNVTHPFQEPLLTSFQCKWNLKNTFLEVLPNQLLIDLLLNMRPITGYNKLIVILYVFKWINNNIK